MVWIKNASSTTKPPKMFLKPYKPKSNVALKGSEAKKFRLRLETAFPNATPEQLQQLLPTSKSISLLKLVTHSGFQTNVFCVDKLPMFFEIEGTEGVLAPTLYAMWQVPDLLPYFTTHAAVLPKLSNGADLMLPGVQPIGQGMNLYGRYKKGQLVAVNITSNKAAAGVGVLTRSSDDLYMCGGQGSAVKMLHMFGDKLWAHEPSMIQQMPNFRPTDLNSDDFPELGADAKKKPKEVVQPVEAVKEVFADVVRDDFPELGADTKKKSKEVVQPVEPAKELFAELAEDTIDNVADEEALSAAVTTSLSLGDEQESTEVSADELLKRAFLAALKNHGKSLQLPLLTSNFFRLYMVPEMEEPVDLKKTKYKKLSGFLREMIDQNFLVIREETKGVDKITSIDLEHPEIVNFITDFKKPTATSDADGQQQPLFHSELTELYVVTDAVAAFFTKLNYKRGEGIPAAQIKKIIREYISKQSLPMQDAATKSVRLDDTLREICNCAHATSSQICGAVTAKMHHSYQMCSVNHVSSNKPSIQMSLATRAGNKKVTLVSNIECYGIIMSEFIKLCKQGAAASTTMVKLPHQKYDMLQIQGNQVRFIFNLLTVTYKVPPKCILGLELARDGKKNKKK